MTHYKRIRDIREDSDMTQVQVADLLFVNRRTYSCYETGTHMIPLEILSKLADLFNTSVDYLMDRTDVKSPYPKPNTSGDISHTIDVTGLTVNQILNIQNIIDDLKAMHQKVSSE